MGVEVAWAQPAVPAFEHADRRDANRLRVDVDHAEPDHVHEAGEAIEAVRGHAVAARVGKEAGAQLCAARGEADTGEDTLQGLAELGVGNDGQDPRIITLHGLTAARISPRAVC